MALVKFIKLAGYLNIYYGCDARIEGFMEIWRGIDAYLVNVDQQLCSPECPCYLTNTLPFTDNPNVVPYFNQWTLTPESYGAIAFQNCTSTVRNSAYTGAITLDPNFDPNSEFNSMRFSDYMSRIENEFNCSGWCRINYINRITGQNMVISKYLFTNINRLYIIILEVLLKIKDVFTL